MSKNAVKTKFKKEIMEMLYCQFDSEIEAKEHKEAGIPLIDFLGVYSLSIWVYRDMTNTDEPILVDNELMEYLELDINTLFAVAIENTSRLFPTDFKLSMGDYFEKYEEFEDSKEEVKNVCNNIMVATNEYHARGASTILYDGYIKNISHILEKDLWLLPASIHEWIIVPHNSDDNLIQKFLEYKKMVHQINDEAILKKERLGEIPLYYSRKSDEIIVPNTLFPIDLTTDFIS